MYNELMQEASPALLSVRRRAHADNSAPVARGTATRLRSTLLAVFVAEHTVLTTLFGVLVFAIGVSTLMPRRMIVLNLSPSCRPGFYIFANHQPAIGSFVEFRSTEAMRDEFPRLANVSASYVVLKPVAAVPGDAVDTTSEFVRINGCATSARILTHDVDGHPLPVWRARRTLSANEFFVLSSHDRGLDSRRFGPLLRDQIITVRAPLLTWYSE